MPRDARRPRCCAWQRRKRRHDRGLRLDDAARVGGRTLQLNGAGLRAGFLDKGYVAALYLPEKVRNATMVLGGSGPKRLQIRPLREVEPDTFIKALDRGCAST